MNLLQEIVNKRTPKTLHNLIGSISQRFSPRVFSSHRIPDKHLEIIFEAARLAPSGRNNQPWFYYWIKKGSRLYKKLESCIPERNSWAFSFDEKVFRTMGIANALHVRLKISPGIVLKAIAGPLFIFNSGI